MAEEEIKLAIQKILSETKYRLPIAKNDKAVYVVDIPIAAAKIIELINLKK